MKPASPITMAEIEALTAAYAAIRADLDTVVRKLQAHIADVRAKHRPAILRLIEEEREALADLQASIALAEDLFRRPKTRTFAGVRVGVVKTPRRLTWTDEAAVVAAIRERYPADADLMIKTEEHPVRTALTGLSDEALAALGIEVEGDCELVTVIPCKSDLDRLIEALLVETTR
ncbi:conserved hypothetical protein [Candidatus Defluviicoccus seviourii]|uniref:Uncharacterized protein n=1 Tax=Candidatus Defluviicoccus seviourii TaxID=2565273 RepID=A0A564WHT3_9PROT|nr:conserved hypothetical protein [Candidatus Defluviicoccus seviourii]